MKKKIIFGVVLLILAILLTLGIKNYVIIQSLEKKFEEYANKDNYHIYNFVHQANGLKTTRDEYKKGNNCANLRGSNIDTNNYISYCQSFSPPFILVKFYL